MGWSVLTVARIVIMMDNDWQTYIFFVELSASGSPRGGQELNFQLGNEGTFKIKTITSLDAASSSPSNCMCTYYLPSLTYVSNNVPSDQFTICVWSMWNDGKNVAIVLNAGALHLNWHSTVSLQCDGLQLGYFSFCALAWPLSIGGMLFGLHWWELDICQIR